MKLTSKLAVLFVLLTTIPLAIVGHLAYTNGRRTIENGTINRLISTTLLKQDVFKRWVEGNEQLLRVLAQRPLVRKYAAMLASQDPADQKYRAAHRSLNDEHLNPHREELKGFLDLFLLRGGDGLVLVSTNEKQEGKYKESQPYFVVGKSRTYVQNAYYSLSLGQTAMAISTPIKDKEGNLIAVLAGHLDLSGISEIMIQQSGLSASEETYLVNKFNFFVTESRFEKGDVLKRALYTDGVKACLAGKNGVDSYADYRGVPVIGAYHWMSEQELCILTEVDQAEAYEPIVALRNTVLGVSAGTALIVALLGILFARTITGPVHQLVQGARLIGQGNMDYRIKVRTRDEIGQLAGAFNEMAADLHRSQEALRDSEAKYSNLTESLDELIYRADPETFVATYVNPAVESIYGYTVEEFLGDPTLWESSIHPEDKERVFACFTESQRNVKSGTIEYRILRKDKTVRWMEDHASWEKDQQGNVVSLNGAMSDITDRKQAEETLRESEAKLKNIIEFSTNLYYSHDTNHVLQYLSPQVKNILGYEVEEALIKWTTFVSDNPINDVGFQKTMNAIETGIAQGPYELELIHKSGKRVWVETREAPVVEKGKTVAIVGSLTDITDRKQAEEALRRAHAELETRVQERTAELASANTSLQAEIGEREQAEERLQEYSKQLEATIAELRDTREQLVRREKLAMLGQLAGGVAHELCNPLAVMNNAVYYLRTIITDADETTREYLELISSEIGNAEAIVSDLLDFSRPRSLEREQVTAAELVARVLGKQPPPEKVKVTIGIPPELPPVFVDPRQTGQVLENLVANACQAMAEGGQVTITAELIEADPIRDPKSIPEEYASHSTGQAIRIRITDTGCGISKENMEKIFEPLFTTRARGIGLGLAVSRNLAELNGGSIEVESEEGKGSTFTVALPVREALS